MNGDRTPEQRFTAVFSHLDRVAAYARRRGATDAAEAAAETMAIAWRRLADVPLDDPLPWLLATARNVVRSQRRAAARATVGLDTVPEPAAPTDEPVWDLDPELAAALAALGPLDREALLLIAWEGLTPGQAARALGISATAFRVRLHRARRRCSALLAAPSYPPLPDRGAPS
ncbi:MAG: sigma factor-like helix-turn-helix DNA-binding protein [Thermoleophilia bacterium]